MKSPILVIALLALAGTAHAEPGKLRDWLHKKTAPQAEQIEPEAAPVAVAPLTAEQQECNRFLADIRAGKVQPNQASQAKSNDCRKRVLAAQPTATATTADAKDLPAVEVKADKPGRRVDGRRLFKSAAKGCGMSVLMGVLGGGGPDLGACAGAAIGAGMADWQQQMKQVREVETAARAAGIQAQVKTSQAKDAKGKPQEKLEALVLPYQPQDMQPVSAKSAVLLDKLAELAKGSSQRLEFTFTGTDEAVCRVPLEELRKRGALADDLHQMTWRCGSAVKQPFAIIVEQRKG